MLVRARLIIAFLAILALALPASASAGTRSETGDAIVVISGDVTVPAGKTVAGVFIAHGDARIAGRVDGDVVVLSGDALVAGTIDGDLVSADGTARLTRTAHVTGDVRYGSDRPVVSDAARVNGDVTNEDWSGSLDFLPFLGGFLIWLAISISSFLLGALLLLIAPRAADALEARAHERIGPVIAIGIAVLICLPIAAVLATVLIVGIPLAIGILLAFAPLAAIAYTAAAYVLGRRLVKPPRGRMLAFLAGLALLRALALIPILGALVGLAAVIFGFGLLGAAIGAARKPEQPAIAAETPGS
ncbi:MAG: polymer-forming cytoskeletal protein [Solirubrobacterales bacterium]